MAKITFVGGPYDGKTVDRFPHRKTAPKNMGCYTDAVKVGMYGIYKRSGTYEMTWMPIDPPKTASDRA